MRTSGKRVVSFILMSLMSFTMTSCVKEEKVKNVLSMGDEIITLDDVKLDYSKAIFDDFSNGVDYSRWIIGNGAWGEKNGGVVPDNVSYTEDGVVLLAGNGNYYAKEEIKGVGELKDGRSTGACLVSKFITGPGHYEIRMKPLPRKGACTAFWTYNNRLVPGQKDRDNHEIDIELPGGKESSDISFRNVLNTNYTTELLNESQDVSLAEATNGKTIFLNDGKFHTFGFEWYTNPKRVVYFVDGYVTAYSDGEYYVPTYQTRVWIGNWFPSNEAFVGNAEFERDYLELDWFKYIPFDESQPSDNVYPEVTINQALEIQYPKTPVSYPKVNLLANGDFEYINKKGTQNGFGWNFSENAHIELTGGPDGSSAALINGEGSLSTNIDSTYDGFKYKLSLDYFSSGSAPFVEVRFKDLGNHIVSLKTIKYNLPNTGGWTHFEQEFEVPEEINSLNIRLRSTDPSTKLCVDNVDLARIYGES